MKILNLEDLDKLMLTGQDIVFNEKYISKTAKKYGTTSGEYRKRDAQADVECKKFPLESNSRRNCIEARLFGLSDNEFKRRWNRADACVLPNVEFEECYFRVMLNIK
jgi:hypothetical protein